jgi:hypothetical protein
MAMRPNPRVRVCVSVSRVPAGRMEMESLPATRRVGVAAPLSVFRPAAWKKKLPDRRKCPPGVHFFHTGVRRRKYKLGQTKQNPSDGGLCDVSAPGVGSFGYGAMRFKSSQLDWII